MGLIRLAAHAKWRLPEAEVADRSFPDRLAHLLQLHRFARVEGGEEIVAGLDTALAECVHEGILAASPRGEDTHPIVIVVEEGHADDGG